MKKSPAPAPVEHLWMRAVVTAHTLVARARDLSDRLVDDKLEAEIPLVYEMLLRSIEALVSNVQLATRDSSLHMDAILRVHVKCLVLARWLLQAQPAERKKRLYRAQLTTALEGVKTATADSAQYHKDFWSQEIQRIQEKARAEGIKQLNRVQIRQFFEESSSSEYYRLYRQISAKVHAGFGMVFAQPILDQDFLISQEVIDVHLHVIFRLILSVDCLFFLMVCITENLELSGVEKSWWKVVLGTFEMEYFKKLRDAYYTVIALYQDANVRKALLDSGLSHHASGYADPKQIDELLRRSKDVAMGSPIKRHLSREKSSP